MYSIGSTKVNRRLLSTTKQRCLFMAYQKKKKNHAHIIYVQLINAKNRKNIPICSYILIGMRDLCAFRRHTLKNDRRCIESTRNDRKNIAKTGVRWLLSYAKGNFEPVSANRGTTIKKQNKNKNIKTKTERLQSLNGKMEVVQILWFPLETQNARNSLKS